MFKQRFLTTIILVPLVLMLLYFGKGWMLATLVLVLNIALGWEWLQLIPAQRWFSKLVFIVALIVAIGLCARWLQLWLTVGLVLWGFNALAILAFPRSQHGWGYRPVVMVLGLVLLPLFTTLLVGLYQQALGKDLIVYLLCLVWATDIGAYLAGKQWGRVKLIPSVSPGKTIEGLMGGVTMAGLVAWGAAFYFHPAHLSGWFAVALATILISIVGDLFISMLKRRCHLKDTGHIIPGHGGVLDRFDSMLAALPMFYFGLQFIARG